MSLHYHRGVAGSGDFKRLAAGVAAIAIVTFVQLRWMSVPNSATASTIFLLIILLVAATSRLRVALATSVVAVFSFNFFFLPPAGTLTIADPQNWIAFFAFLAVSLVASQLSSVARTRTDEARGRRDELARLFDLSRDVLVITESSGALSRLAAAIARRFDLSYVAIAVPQGADWEISEAGSADIALDRRELAAAFATAQASMEFDAAARTYAGHRTMEAGGRTIRLVPLRVGTKPIGLLAAVGRPVEAGTLDTLGGVVAIAIERARFLGEIQAGELTRQSEELKTALLASLAHDLRTPLTAIRIAATNIEDRSLTASERLEQRDLILSEVGRLTRLFQNILEMARIDAGAVAADTRWVHPSEIIAAARDQAEHTLRLHAIDVVVEPDTPVRLDPRLTAAALAQVLENAGQYAQAGSTITVRATATDDALTIAVRDQGPGIAPEDLPRLFERFYRGAATGGRVPGTGMGLWIARGLLAAEQGRVWAENWRDGAQFTISVPAAVRAETVETPSR